MNLQAVPETLEVWGRTPKAVVVALNNNPDMAFIADTVIRQFGEPIGGTWVSPDHLSPGRRRGTFTRATASPWFVLDWFLAIVSAGSIRRSDVVCVVNFHPSNIFYLLVALLAGRPRLLFLHDIRTHYRGMKGCANLLLNRIMVALATELAVFSRRSREDAKRLLCRDAIVLPLPSPAERFMETPLTLPAGWALERRKFGIFWGRAYAYKGLGYLPSIARLLQEEGLKLVISCSPGDRESREILEQVRQHPNVVAIDGPLPDSLLAALVSNACMNFCPYLEATQSGVLVYCMALGVPSIVSKETGLEQWIDEMTGEAVDFRVDADVKRAIARVKTLRRSDIVRRYGDLYSSRALSEEIRGAWLSR